MRLNFCKHCACAKAHRQPYKRKDKKTRKKRKKKNKSGISKKNHKIPTWIEDEENENSKTPTGVKVVIDLKTMPESTSGNKFMCIFTDVGSRLSTTVFLETKGEFKNHYIKYMKWYRNQCGNYPKIVHTDGGGEFVNKIIENWNDKKGIHHTTTSPHSSKQNPIAERTSRTISEGSLSLLLCAHLPTKFWEYSTNFMNYIKNRTPHKSLNFSNPITEWNGELTTTNMINLLDIRTFGCEAYVLDNYHKKNMPKAFRCIYLGPSLHQKGSIFYRVATKTFMVSRNFVLNEQNFPGRELYPRIYEKYFEEQLPNSSLGTIENIEISNPNQIANYNFSSHESKEETKQSSLFLNSIILDAQHN